MIVGPSSPARATLSHLIVRHIYLETWPRACGYMIMLIHGHEMANTVPKAQGYIRNPLVRVWCKWDVCGGCLCPWLVARPAQQQPCSPAPVHCVQSLYISIGGHRHRSQCRRYPISDIDICYSDIGDKYVGLKNIIPISEVFRYRHQSSFRYPTLKKKYTSSCRIEPALLGMVSRRYNIKLLWLSV
jgi:hypothetical protein